MSLVFDITIHFLQSTVNHTVLEGNISQYSSFSATQRLPMFDMTKCNYFRVEYIRVYFFIGWLSCLCCGYI